MIKNKTQDNSIDPKYRNKDIDNTRENDHHIGDDIFICIFENEKFCISIRISLKFVPNGAIGNNPALV